MPAEKPGELIVAEPSGRYARRMPVVGDCSVLAAVLFDEPERSRTADALAGMEIVAPFLLDYELASVAVKKARQGLEDVVCQGLTDLAELEVTRRPVDVIAQWQLALECDVSAYDAAYLQLAARPASTAGYIRSTPGPRGPASSGELRMSACRDESAHQPRYPRTRVPGEPGSHGVAGRGSPRQVRPASMPEAKLPTMTRETVPLTMTRRSP